jgi:hypothetical protein
MCVQRAGAKSEVTLLEDTVVLRLEWRRLPGALELCRGMSVGSTR